MRVVSLLILTAVLLFADAFKLYLKDGSYHAVREYQIQSDRVRYFSTERGEWEEIPKELVDIAKTEQERKSKQEQQSREARELDEEDQAERAVKREIASIPMEPGAYYKLGEKVELLPSADYQVITDKKRRAIQLLSPVPLVPGKAVVVIKGDHSSFVVSDDRPNFFFRLAKQERFGIIEVTPKKNMRVVEDISIAPVVKQADEQRKQMKTFEQDLGNGLFKIWPEQPLRPGEYAVVEFADAGDATELQLLVWDFACRPSPK